MVIWICGLSASGKSTLGRHLFSILKAKNPNLVLLDGEELRSVFGDSIGYDKEAREKNSARIGNLCRLLDSQNILVICCAVTISPEVQADNRKHLSEYCEVFLDVTLDTVRRRDPKGIYQRADCGEIKNVAGVDIPFVPPANPDLVIDNNFDHKDMEPLVRLILEKANISNALPVP
jgi:adenylylsulfate kinase